MSILFALSLDVFFYNMYVQKKIKYLFYQLSSTDSTSFA